MAAKRGRHFGIPAARIVVFLALSVLTSWAQSAGPGQTLPQGVSPSPSRNPLGDGSLDEPPPRFSDSMRAKRNEDRQRRLASDSQRLLVLANLLKNEVAASGAETITPDMLRQVDEIEHLAKSVKDKMRN